MRNIKRFLAPALIIFGMGAISGSIALGIAHAVDQNDLGGSPVNITEGILAINGPQLFSASGTVPAEIRGYDDDGQRLRLLWPELTGNIDLTLPSSLPAGSNYPVVGNASGVLSFGASALPSTFISGTGTDNQLVMWDGTTDLQDVPNWSGAGGVLQFNNSGDAAALTLVNTGDTRTQFNNDGTMYWGDSSGSLDTTWAWEADGAMSISGNAAGGAWRFKEAALNGNDYVGFKAPDSLSASASYELPSDTPSNGQQLTWNTGGTLSWEAAGGGGSGMTSLTLSADSGSDQTLTDGDTIELAGGSNGIDTAASATDTVTFNFDASEVGSVTWGTAPTWTFPTSVLFTTGFLTLGNGATGGGSLRLAEDTDFGTNTYEFTCTGPLTADMSIGLKYDATLNDGDVLTYHAMGTTWDTPATTYYQTVRDEGSDETARGKINFIGRSVDVTDDSGNDETEVAILDDYTLSVQALTHTPGDGATVYFGQLPKAPVTTAGNSKVYIRESGTIVAANIYSYSGTAGTGENWSLYIRLNNTTDTLIETIGASASERVFDNSSLSISVSAGDYIEIKSVQPTFATNPATTIYGGYLLIRR